jgi:K+-transporting ATPase ATPase A chain
MVGEKKQGYAILAAMGVIWAILVLSVTLLEANAPGTAFEMAGASMEGKETRFGEAASSLFAVSTTGTSTGAVNSFHSSFTAVSGGLLLFNMGLGEVAPGGVGSGLYGMLAFAIIAVFVAGLMVGRTPEYLGKKIEAYEMKMASLVILIPPAVVLIGTAAAVLHPAALASMQDKGPHGFSEVLYAFSSMGNNNGSAFAGYNANIPYVNTTGGFAMLFARYWLAVPTLAIAGALARKKSVPSGPGTLPTHQPLFVGLLIGVVALVGALSFLPALAVGPIVEHLMLVAAK